MTIKEIRVKYGLTQSQVSNITGVPFRSIQNWEAGVRKCPDYVEKMVVTMIENTFKTLIDGLEPRVYLEDLLEMLQSDVKYAKSEETKTYINNLITDISEELNK